MHELVLHVRGLRLFVVVRAESSNALIAQVNLERVDSPHQKVETDVKFLIIDEKWVFDVPL